MSKAEINPAILESFLQYLDRGFSVIPVGQNKRPMIKWQQHQRRRATKEEIEKWCWDYPNVNVGIVTGTISGIIVLDVDPRHGGLETLKDKVIPLTPTVKTGGGGYHYYFTHTGVEIRNFQKRDDLPGLDLRGDGGYVVAPPSIHSCGNKYEWIVSLDQGLAELPFWVYNNESQEKSLVKDLLNGVPEGARNDSLARIAGWLFAKDLDLLDVLTQCRDWNTKNSPPLPEDEVRKTVESIYNKHLHSEEENTDKELSFQSSISSPNNKDFTVSWPNPPTNEAFYGLSSEFVRLIEPHTEADPIALLIQFFVAFGNMVGRGPYYRVEADNHYPNIYAVMVGPTSKARKGTSLGYIRRISESVDSAWVKDHIKSGLSSGEGLIWAVRDEILKTEPIKNNGKYTGETQEILADPGIDDKRLLVVECEFASILRILGREGNILSPIIRDAWDTGDLRILTKNNPAVATGAHISIIGHITKDELRKHLNGTEVGNGFANRFLWVCVRRSKCLPEGGKIEEIDFAPFLGKLNNSLKFTKTVEKITLDACAREIWNEVYPRLSDGKPGLVGAIISRGEAQVVRLAMIYALLDCSAVIRKEHLLAAISLWEYCEASAKFIFGLTLGNCVADTILANLQNHPEGLSRTQIRDLFARNMNYIQIELALDQLQEQGLGFFRLMTTKGRPEERWFVAIKKYD